MQDQEYDTMRQVEDAYWWYQVLRTATAREVSRLAAGNESACILDAGCGTGGTLDRLRKQNASWQLSGFDFSPHAVEHTRGRGFTDVQQGDIANIPAGDAELDGIVSLDVLCHQHVDQPRAFREMHRTLKPGGFLVLNLPAFNLLFGSHDKAVGSARRYTKARVREALETAGFSVEREQYWNAWLFPPICAWRILSKFLTAKKEAVDTKSDLGQLPPLVNNTLAKVGLADFAICRALSLPFGTSVFTVARKA